MTRMKALWIATMPASLTIGFALVINTREGLHPHVWIYPPLWLAAVGVFAWEIYDLNRGTP